MQGRTLHQRLVAVANGIGGIRKSGKHSQFGYAFFTDADLADPIRALLVEHGVVLAASVVSHAREEFPNSKGGTSERVTVSMRFAFINADNPDDREVYEWAAHITDPNDRGLSKAIANARKTFLVTQFLVCEETADTPKAAALPSQKEPNPKAPPPHDPRNAEFQKMRDWWAACKVVGAPQPEPVSPETMPVEAIAANIRAYKSKFYSVVADFYTVLSDRKLNKPADDSDQHAFESFPLAKQVRIAQAWRDRIEKAGT